MKITSVEFIHSKSDRTYQREVGIRWLDNKLKILITTTLGLVGNECSRCQLVVVVGYLYDIPSIIQAMGRIRPHRRNERSSFMLFGPEISSEEYQEKKEAERKHWNVLKNNNLVNDEIRLVYNKSMTQTSVISWAYQTKTCRVQYLKDKMGSTVGISNICGCDVCNNKSKKQQLRSNGIKRAQIYNQKQIEVQLSERDKANEVLKLLSSRCLLCNRQVCDGTCAVKKEGRCLKCGSRKHTNALCTQAKAHTKPLHNIACFCCFQYNVTGRPTHIYGQSSIKERLKYLFLSEYVKETEFVQSKATHSLEHFLYVHFSNVDSYYKFLSKHYKQPLQSRNVN